MIDQDDALLNDDDVVDAFPMDIQPSMVAAGGGMTEVISHMGIFEIANIELSFEVECLPGFVGESCVPDCSTDPCSNNGTCLESVRGFTCACRGDFTGETCETRISDCQDVDCNDGTCVDGVLSFTCQCDPGFTGDFCEEMKTMTTPPDILITTLSDSPMTTLRDSPITALPDTTPPETPLPNSPIPGSTTSRNGATVSLGGDNSGSNVGAGGSSGGSSNSVSAVAGAVVGSIVVLITIAIVTILLILCIRRRKASSKPGQGTSPLLRLPQFNLKLMPQSFAISFISPWLPRHVG